MRNCPNCGAPMEPYKCKCEYCGTWYFDFTSFDMSKDEPYYVKFKTPYGIITTLARPELETINVYDDSVNALDCNGNIIHSFYRSKWCDFGVVFHAVSAPGNNELYRIET